MAFLVNQRIREFGIRSALGAQPRDILMLAFRPGLVLTSAGILAGLAASIPVTHLISSLRFGVSANDPLIFATVPVVLVVVTMAACNSSAACHARFAGGGAAELIGAIRAREAHDLLKPDGHRRPDAPG